MCVKLYSLLKWGLDGNSLPKWVLGEANTQLSLFCMVLLGVIAEQRLAYLWTVLQQITSLSPGELAQVLV